MIANVASKCGFTSECNGLQALHEQYAPRSCAVLAFPYYQFDHREPESDQEIAAFRDRSYGVTFPVFAKIAVDGPRTHPLYLWLRQQKGGLLGSGIKWNFTTFLIDKTGGVRARFASTTTPEGLSRDVAALV